jgi:predicted small secreted protein
MNTNTEDTTSRNVGFFTFVFGLLILTLSFASCSTTRGFGRDVKKVGNKIEQTANRVDN